MDQAEMEAILANSVRRLTTPGQVPSNEDWSNLRERFNCDFDPDFVHFMELVPYYDVPTILNIGPPQDAVEQDAIAVIYDHEINGNRGGNPWNPDMIPFNQIGNGDYECLSAKEGVETAVYYVHHTDGHLEKEYDSVEEWIKDIPGNFGD